MRMRALIASVAVTTGCLLAVAPAGAAVSTPQSGWTWGSPTPQGYTLLTMEFAGGRGYATGGFGTVLRTDDGGSTWTGLRTGITQTLFRLRAIDADTFIVGGGCTLRRSDDSGQTFRRIRFTSSERSCGAPVTSFSFVSEDVGYILLGDGTVQRTTNGGQGLSQQTAVPGTPATEGSVPATDIFFTSSTTGLATTRAGVIYRTTDAAESWVQVANVSRPLRGLYFADATTGYAVGDGNALLRTDDGGVTWAARPLVGVPNSDLRSIRCATTETCLVTTEAGDRILRTVDGGATATAVSPSTQNIFAAAFQTPTRVVAAGDRGATVVSSNAGETFSAIGSRLAARFSRLRATSPQLVHAPGNDGNLGRTLDGGELWRNIGVATSEDVLDVSFVDENVGFALDVGGAALRTNNGGEDWNFLDTGTTERPNAVLALDSDRVLLVGPRGLRRSTDAGTVFQGVFDPDARRALLVDIDQAGQALFAYGSQALILSTDGGQSWRPVARPGPLVRRLRPSLVAVDFIDARTGYALTVDGLNGSRTWRTANGGRSWRELAGIGTDRATSLAFGGEGSGWLAVSSFGDHDAGYVLRTSDGGRSWRPQLVSAFPIRALGLVAPDDSVGFALDSLSNLFGTSTGGDAETGSSLALSTQRRTVRLKKPRRRGQRQRPVTLTVTGRLEPAVGGADVVVSRRNASGGVWRSQTVQVSSTGTFTTSWEIDRTSHFVAQWRGDEDRNGDGSPVLTVGVTGIVRPEPAPKPRSRPRR